MRQVMTDNIIKLQDASRIVFNQQDFMIYPLTYQFQWKLKWWARQLEQKNGVE